MVRWQDGQRTVGMTPIVSLFLYTVYGKTATGWVCRDGVSVGLCRVKPYF
jgi:hypothetical protein